MCLSVGESEERLESLQTLRILAFLHSASTQKLQCATKQFILMNQSTGYSFLLAARALSWRAFMEHWSSRLFLMAAYSALLPFNACFSSRLRSASSITACKVSLSSELTSAGLFLPTDLAARFKEALMPWWPQNFNNIIKSSHNPATIWRDARCKGDTRQN